MSTAHVVVIGGGPAGFFGATACAEIAPRRRVLLLEKSRQVLAKVKVSGGGRCNVTHACFDPAGLVQHYPRGGKALRGPFTRFHPGHVVEWFESRGVLLKTEPDGRMFPVTDQSQTIIDALVGAARRAEVEVRTEVAIQSVSRRSEEAGGGFVVTLADGDWVGADQLLLATGSNAHGWQWARDFGHTIVEPVPSLFTFMTGDARLRELAGVVVSPARLQLTGANLTQTGPVLVTHWGLSGPAVLKLSAWGARVLHDTGYEAELAINWLPTVSETEVRHCLQAQRQIHPSRAVGAQPPFDLPKRLWTRLTSAAAISEAKRWAELSKTELNQLVQQLQYGRYAIQGKGAFKEEFVTCGGVRLDEVNLKTMESRRCPGLYFAGEILDIDGVTGGFNFQSAWTTAHLAGVALASL